MSDDQTPEDQLAQVALAALSEGLYAFEHDNQLQAQQLREQLDLLGRWAMTHNDPDGRMLQSVAMALRLLTNGGITGIVRRIAATLQKAHGSPPDGQ
jgi:hypothetical protein